MAAPITCFFAFPFANSRSQNAAISGLKRLADIAGRYKALRRRALPTFEKAGLPCTKDPLERSLGVKPA